MERVTVKELQAIMGRMERNLGGDPDKPVWTCGANGRSNQARIGALVLQQGSRTYGNAWAISQIVTEGGGERTLLRAMTARDLANMAYAWCDGFEHRERYGVQS